MSNITASDTINNALIWIDQVCDYTPIAGTVTNLINIFEKCVFKTYCTPECVNSNRYFSYINDKSILRCVILLLPILGNIIIGIYDLIQNHQTEIIKQLSNDRANLSLSIETTFSCTPDHIKKSFVDFIEELEGEIFPSYKAHEKSFDKPKLHSRMHIARAVIFSELIARYYHNQGKTIDFDWVRRAIGWHDAARKANGPDLWEKESSQLFYNYLTSKGMPKEEAKQKSTIIDKKNTDKSSIEYIAFQSGDCLDIMRILSFKANYLTFLAKANPAESQLRDSLIKEAERFIQLSEKQKHTIHFSQNENFMKNLFGIIRSKKSDFPILSSILYDRPKD